MSSLTLMLATPINLLSYYYKSFFTRKSITEIYNYGDPELGYSFKGKPQDFYELRKKHLNDFTLFEDPAFPANDSSITGEETNLCTIKWKRPKELMHDPHFEVDGFTKFDVMQGEIGDCWFLAALADLTLNPDIFAKVVPQDQSFLDSYAGIFHFRFYQYGKWIDVCIDDRLPVYDNNRLRFLASNENNEFWSALLEKAYAKLYGSYDALTAGVTAEAMEDFTGGLAEQFNMETTNLFKVLLRAYKRKSLIGTLIKTDDDNAEDKHRRKGLIAGHAYSITKVLTITTKQNQNVNLLRIRNPWGEGEWQGAWCDNSSQWQGVNDDDKKELGLVFDNDGEFFIDFEDYKKVFENVTVCNVNPYFKTELVTHRWRIQTFEGSWSNSALTSGGHKAPWRNPQYMVIFNSVQEDEDELIISVMQKAHNREMKHYFGFAVYIVENLISLTLPLKKEWFMEHTPYETVKSSNSRERTGRFPLRNAGYLIIPATYEPNLEASFLVRVYSEEVVPSRNKKE